MIPRPDPDSSPTSPSDTTNNTDTSHSITTPVTGDIDKEDEFDYLFESDEHMTQNSGLTIGEENLDNCKVTDNEMSSERDALDNAQGPDSIRPTDLNIPKQPVDIAQEPRTSTMTPLDKLEQEALQRHIENIVQDIRDYLEKIQTMYIVVYEQLDTVTGRELIYGCLEESFYKPIWGYILEMYRYITSILCYV